MERGFTRHVHTHARLKLKLFTLYTYCCCFSHAPLPLENLRAQRCQNCAPQSAHPSVEVKPAWLLFQLHNATPAVRPCALVPVTPSLASRPRPRYSRLAAREYSYAERFPTTGLHRLDGGGSQI